VPPTLNKTHECKIIRKIFSSNESADQAIEAFKNWEIPPQDLAVVVRFDEEEIKDRDHQECHRIDRRWLASWDYFRKSQIRPKATPLLRNIPIGITVSRYQK